MSCENEILLAYLQASHEVSSLFRAHYGKMNLTFPQAMVLSLLDTEGPMPISSLAERTGSANSTISGVVDRLAKMGLVRRRRGREDRRIINVEVTDYYNEKRSKVKTNVIDFFTELLADVSDEDKKKILEGFTILSDALQDYSNHESDD